MVSKYSRIHSKDDDGSIDNSNDDDDVEMLKSKHNNDEDDNSNMATSTIPVVISKDAPTAITMKRLLELAKPERHLLILSAITLGLGSVVGLAVPTYAGKIIDVSLQNQDERDETGGMGPYQLLMSLLGIMTLAGIAGFFRILWQAQAGHRLVARIRRKLYAAILSQDAAYFDATPQGDIISRLSSDADLVQSAVTDQALGLLRNIIISIGAVVLLFLTSISLALVSVAILPPIAICARLVGRRMKDRQIRVRELHAVATSLAEQSLTCIRTVQQFVAESYESQQYNNAINEAHAQAVQTAQLKAMFGSTLQLVINLALLCVLGYGGHLVSNGKLSAGDLASFVMYAVMMGSNISRISEQYIDLMKAIAAANRIFEIIDREPSIPPPIIVEPPENEWLVVQDGMKTTKKMDSLEMMELSECTMTTITTTSSCCSSSFSSSNSITTNAIYNHNNHNMIPMAVTFNNVSFAYPTRSDSKILNGLNLSIKAGQVVALVGGSGAGKSTIASLLTRLYDPQYGYIEFNNTKISTMDPQHVRQNVGIVVQEPLLFPTTIEDNIRYGCPNATLAQVKEAAELAYVTEFVNKFPNGLQTIVGVRGTQLSGGQKQRVAVARCILKNPPIVIFDEATSALDAQSESQIQKTIDNIAKKSSGDGSRNRTVIIIAHRLSTIRNVDMIAVLCNGKITEIGSFDELMNNKTKKMNNNPSSSSSSEQPSTFRNLMEKQLLQ